MNESSGQVRRQGPAAAGRRSVDAPTSSRAARTHWDSDAVDYQAEHAAVLGESAFVWGPEGLQEAEAQLLGDVGGLRILELGCGGAQCSRWLKGAGATVIGIDISAGMLAQSRRLDQVTGTFVTVVQADAQHLPFSPASFDLVVSAFGAVPFVADSAAVMSEISRVLRPGGRFALSLVHPFRWVFPDDPDPAALTVRQSYFDRTPYVEEDDSGEVVYVEHHRTIGDRVREIRAAGLILDDLIEPEWVREDPAPWGAWSPERAALVPGTAILLGHKG